MLIVQLPAWLGSLLRWVVRTVGDPMQPAGVAASCGHGGVRLYNGRPVVSGRPARAQAMAAAPLSRILYTR
jgi:hypothetical protein